MVSSIALCKLSVQLLLAPAASSSSSLLSHLFVWSSALLRQGLDASTGAVVAQTLCVPLALFTARFSLLQPLVSLWLSGDVVVYRPLLVSSWLLLSSALSLPISVRHCTTTASIRLRRAHGIALLLAAALTLIQPRMSLSSSSSSSSSSFGSWLLLVAVSFVALTLSSVLAVGRPLFAVTTGACTGAYLVSSYLSFLPLLPSVLIVCSVVCSSLLLVYTVWPVAGAVAGGRRLLLPLLFLLLFPLTIASILHSFPLGRSNEHRDTALVSLLLLYSVTSFLLALTLKLTVAGSGVDHHQHHQHHQRQWLGNTAVLICFLLSSFISVFYLSEPFFSIAFLSPLLLLLQQDGLALRHWREERRWVPVAVVASVFLLLSTLSDISALHSQREALLLLLALPSAYLVVESSLFPRVSVGAFRVLTVGPLCAVDLLFSRLPSTRLLCLVALLALVYSRIQHHRLQREGLRII